MLHWILCRVEEAAKADHHEERKKEDYYQLPIPRANIHFLQTWEETQRCWEKVLRVSAPLGFALQGQGAAAPHGLDVPRSVSLAKSRTTASFWVV